MSKDTDIIASSHTIATIIPEMNQQQRLYLFRELRDAMPKALPDRKADTETDAQYYKALGYNLYRDEAYFALCDFFGIEGNAV